MYSEDSIQSSCILTNIFIHCSSVKKKISVFFTCTLHSWSYDWVKEGWLVGISCLLQLSPNTTHSWVFPHTANMYMYSMYLRLWFPCLCLFFHVHTYRITRTVRLFIYITSASFCIYAQHILHLASYFSSVHESVQSSVLPYHTVSINLLNFFY